MMLPECYLDNSDRLPGNFQLEFAKSRAPSTPPAPNELRRDPLCPSTLTEDRREARTRPSLSTLG